MDSFALPLNFYETAHPLQEWIVKHWKYEVSNGKLLQALSNKSCGHYAFMYVKLKAAGGTLQDFLNLFSDHNFGANYYKVGQMLACIIKNELAWTSV